MKKKWLLIISLGISAPFCDAINWKSLLPFASVMAAKPAVPHPQIATLISVLKKRGYDDLANSPFYYTTDETDLAGAAPGGKIAIAPLLFNFPKDMWPGILLHEKGHCRKHHVLKKSILSCISLASIMMMPALYLSYHLPAIPFLFCQAGLASALRFGLLAPLDRHFEYQADRYAFNALRTERERKAFIIFFDTCDRLFCRTRVPNDRLKKFLLPITSFFADPEHPTYANRVRALRKLQKQKNGPCAPPDQNTTKKE